MRDLERERDAAVRTRDKAVEEALRAQRSSATSSRPMSQGEMTPRAGGEMTPRAGGEMTPRAGGEMTPRAGGGGADTRRSLTPVKSPRQIDPSMQMIGIGILLRVFKTTEVCMYVYMCVYNLAMPFQFN